MPIGASLPGLPVTLHETASWCAVQSPDRTFDEYRIIAWKLLLTELLSGEQMEAAVMRTRRSMQDAFRKRICDEPDVVIGSADCTMGDAEELCRQEEWERHFRGPCGFSAAEKLCMLIQYVTLGMSLHDTSRDITARRLYNEALETARMRMDVLCFAAARTLIREGNGLIAEQLVQKQDRAVRALEEWQKRPRILPQGRAQG
jgi:hypothetical protein